MAVRSIFDSDCPLVGVSVELMLKSARSMIFPRLFSERPGLTRLKLLCLILLGAILLGAVLGAFLGLEAVGMLPSLRAAASRAILIAKTIFQALRPLGLDGAQVLILSLGIGIFANNALTAMIILLSPILIILAKSFSDKHLSKLYYEHGIWLFKPVGWTTYRILSLILPSYALGLQSYLIGGTLLSRKPFQYLRDYTRVL